MILQELVRAIAHAREAIIHGNLCLTQSGHVRPVAVRNRLAASAVYRTGHDATVVPLQASCSDSAAVTVNGGSVGGVH